MEVSYMEGPICLWITGIFPLLDFYCLVQEMEIGLSIKPMTTEYITSISYQ